MPKIGYECYEKSDSEYLLWQQLSLIHIFAPFFTAYGTAFVLNLIARHSNKEVVPVLRGGVPSTVLITCCSYASFRLDEGLNITEVSVVIR